MRMNITGRIAIAAFALISFPAMLLAQTQTEFTDDAFIKKGNLIVEQFGSDHALLTSALADLAIEYAALPSGNGLAHLFTMRLEIPKDRLRSVFDALPEELRSSQYGRSIRMHLDTEQIEAGSKYFDFDAVTDSDEAFRLSSLAGKKILFIYGGMHCMQQVGRDYMNALYERTSRDDFEIVMYCYVSDIEGLRTERTTFPCNYLLVSDFLKDSSPVKIIYGTQATPAFFFINRDGTVRKTVGFSAGEVDKLIAEDA